MRFHLTKYFNCHRREIVELFLRGLRTELTMETMNLLLEHLRRSPNEEQALGAVLLLHFDHALVCCFSPSSVAPNCI